MSLYRPNLSLLTDFYQLTMAYAAWKSGGTSKWGVFDLYFRKNPFDGGYAISCGQSSVRDFIANFRVSASDCEYLASLCGVDQKPLFEPAFLEFLQATPLTLHVDAVAEGRVVFANEPLLRVEGPIWQCQLLETPLLTLMNFETLIATRAARIKEVAGTDAVLEFGLRRAQGIDGALTASRASYIGGADATSNILAGQLWGIPLRGTHAHSWVMSFDSEAEAFERFAEAMPNNCTLLVDTYNTLEGVRQAIDVAQKMKRRGQAMMGIRLDSGDLAWLSIEARKRLDAAGLHEVKIVASNDLDEHLMADLKHQGAQIDIWGIGTKLVTASEQPALGGVFKLVAMKEAPHDTEWKYRIKLSEQMAKVTTPGVHQVRRFSDGAHFLGDMVFDVTRPVNPSAVMIDPADGTRQKSFPARVAFEDLLQPLIRNGQPLPSAASTLQESRERRALDLSRLDASIKRLKNPHSYPMGLEQSLHQMKTRMILEKRGG